ncbi:uncharacterized protein LOC115282537 [Suricata suricatta]|uniref:uncharacterized protein LOC115282537 n=1 Tax=Suricata suricatta TaxID=37032 RepID=UPI001155A106|nr:uncharacterized protein LOC115282537 [Suricata suricatta]
MLRKYRCLGFHVELGSFPRRWAMLLERQMQPRGVELSESVCQPGAEINAWSWCLGSRQQGRTGSVPRQGLSLGGNGAGLIQKAPLQFFNPEGVPPRKGWARPHLLPNKKSPPVHQPAQDCDPALCLSFSHSWGGMPGLPCVSLELWEGKNYIWKLDRSWALLCSPLTAALKPRCCQARFLPGWRLCLGTGGGDWDPLGQQLPEVLEPLGCPLKSLKLPWRERTSSAGW